MARSYIKLKLAVWRTDFTDLTLEAQWLYWVLTAHPATSAAGVLPLQPRKWASRASNASTDLVDDALRQLVDASKVIIDHDTEEVLIRTFIRHDEGWRNTNMRKGIIAAIDRIESNGLRDIAAKELLRLVKNPESERSTEDPCEHPSQDPGIDPSQHPPEDPCQRSTEGAWQPNCNLKPETNSANGAGNRARDPLYDALVEACGMDYSEMTAKQRSSTGVARAELAKVGATPTQVHERARIYARKFPKAALTPHALANHWAALNERRPATSHIDTTTNAQMSEHALRNS